MVKDIFLFATLRLGGLRHYYQPNSKNLIELLDNTCETIQDRHRLEDRKLLIAFAYEIGNQEIIPLILRQKGSIPDSWRFIQKLYKKHFPKKSQRTKWKGNKLNRLWILYALYATTIFLDVATTHIGLQLPNLAEANIHIIKLWNNLGYANTMLLKIVLALTAGLCIYSLQHLATKDSKFMKFLVVLLFCLVAFNSYIVFTNIKEIVS